MQVVAICPFRSAQHPTGYYIFEAETLEDAKRKGYQCCNVGQFLSSLHIAETLRPVSALWSGGERHNGSRYSTGELIWKDGELYHCIVDDICKLINDSFGIKTQIIGKESRILFCPNKKDHFARIEVVNGERVDISMALYDNCTSVSLADPDCFDNILNYIDEHRR
jgi:hypothetical protein